MRAFAMLAVLLLASPVQAEPEPGAGSGAEAGAGADTATESDPGAETEIGDGTGMETGTDSESGTGTGDGIGDGDGTGSGTGTGAPAPPPKIAIVVAGDPDETIRNTAAFIEQEAVLSGMQAPSDPALRAAMRGESPTEEDGLERLRSIRRGLGLDPRKDQASYRRIGLIAGADALVVVRRQGNILVEVFDVAAAQFYEGVLDFDGSESEERVAFIESRAEQAQLRWSTPPPPPPEKKGPEVNEPKEKEDSRAKKRWKKAWPYVIVGALVAGGVTYLIIDRRNAPSTGVPLLRFRPGEE